MLNELRNTEGSWALTDKLLALLASRRGSTQDAAAGETPIRPQRAVQVHSRHVASSSAALCWTTRCRYAGAVELASWLRMTVSVRRSTCCILLCQQSLVAGARVVGLSLLDTKAPMTTRLLNESQCMADASSRGRHRGAESSRAGRRRGVGVGDAPGDGLPAQAPRRRALALVGHGREGHALSVAALAPRQRRESGRQHHRRHEAAVTLLHSSCCLCQHRLCHASKSP